MRVFRLRRFGLEVQSLQTPGEPVIGRERPVLSTCGIENEWDAAAFHFETARFAAIAPQSGTGYFSE
jgi:hypothetical protein